MTIRKLSDCLELVIDRRGVTPKKLNSDWSDDGYRVLSANNIKTTGLINCETIRKIDEETYRKWMKDEIQRGDILLTSEAPAGEVFYWDSDEKIVCGQRVFVLRTKPDVYPLYLKYYLQSSVAQNEIRNKCSGSTVFGISVKMFDSIKVDIPDDYETQKKVADYLYSIDNKIDLNNQINFELDSLAKTVYDYWFLQFEFPNEEGKPYKSSGGKMVWNDELKREIPEGWYLEKLINLVSDEKNSIVDGPFGTQLKVNEYTDDGVPVYEMYQLNNNFIMDANISHFISNKKYLEVKRSSVKNGDIIISKTGTLGLLGIVNSKRYEKGIIVSRLAKITPDENKIGKYGLLIYLKKLTDSNYWLNKSGGSTMPILNNSILEDVPLVYSKSGVFNKFEYYIAPIFEKIFNIQQQNQQLESLRDFLLPLLMNGQVTFKKDDENA